MSTTATDNTSFAQLLALTPPQQRVLLVDQDPLVLGRELKDRGCVVAGVALDPGTVTTSSPVLDHVVGVEKTDDPQLNGLAVGEEYDALVVARLPKTRKATADLLGQMTSLLSARGAVIVAVPNATHGSRRLIPLAGRAIEDEGLALTHAQLLDLLDALGLTVTDVRGVVQDPLDSDLFSSTSDEILGAVPGATVEWVRNQPDAMVAEFVAVARPRRAQEPVGRGIPVREVVAQHQVRRRDRFTEEVERAARDQLVARDHIIGLQAEATNAHANAEGEVRQKMADLDTRLRMVRGRLRARSAEVKSLKAGSRAMKREVANLRRENEVLRQRLEDTLTRRIRRRVRAAARKVTRRS